MKGLSLRTKGLFIILLISFITLMIIGLYNYTSVKNSMVEKEIENIRLKQESRSFIISSWLETRKAEVLVMSRTNEVRSGSTKSMMSYLDQEQELNAFQYAEIGFVRPSGVVTSLTGGTHSLSKEFPINRSLKGDIVLSDPMIQADKNERLGYISVPVYSMDSTNHLIGALYVAYSFPPAAYAETLHIDKGNLFLYNFSGELLYDHVQSDLTPQEDTVIRNQLKQLAALSLTKQKNYEYVSIMNVKYIVFYQKIENTNWVIIEIENVSEIEALAAPTLWNMLVVVGVAICLIAIVFYTYFQNIVTRLEDILSVTKQAADGNFEAEHLNASNGDEIGVLANSVNGMMRRLQIMFDRLDAVINQNKSPVFVMDERYVVTYLNHAAEEMLGYSSEEVVGKATPLLFMDMEEVRQKAAQFSQEIGREVQPGVELFLELRRHYSNYDFDLTIVTRDHKRIPVFNRSSSLRDRNGRYSGNIAILTDISEQKQLENVNNRLQMVVESAKDLIASVDQNANIIYINEAGRKMLGSPDVDFSQLSLTSFLPDHMYRLLRRGSVIARKQGFFECEAQFQNIEGKYINVSIIIVTYQDSITGETMYSCISRDITEQLEVQRKLVHATEVAEQANEAKSNFLALMSHEIRTPLNGVIGLSQLLQKTELDQLQQEYVQHMKDSTIMLLNIVNDVLDFSKLEAQKLEPDLNIFNIYVLVNHLADQLSVFLGGKEQFEFKIEIDSAVPHSMLGDSLRLEQILTNLCVNAIKFTEQGLVELDIAVKSKRNDEIELLFKVKDTGIGMTEEQLRYLFKPFTQADSSTTRKYGGTGLGLVISKSLVELLGGQIKAESIKDQGSVFTFTLPFKQVEYQFTPETSKWSCEEDHVVWVLEDHKIMSKYWSKLLAEFNYNTVEKRYWKDAFFHLLRLGEGAYPALILMDMEMNDMYGMDTWLEFKKEAAIRKIPTIAVTTAYGREELLMLDLELQPDAILTKPVTKKRFQDAIEQVLFKYFGSEQKITTPLAADPIIEEFSTVMEQNMASSFNVLLAEDNKVNQLVAAEMLRHCDCEVTIAANGLEALDRLSKGHYDLVLMDIHMPIMDGLEATRIIRSQEKYYDLPIIAVTANILTSDHEKYLLQGMNAVLTKPLSIEQLEAAIIQYTNKSKLLSKQEIKIPVEVNKELLEKLELMQTINTKEALERVSGKINIYMHMLEQFFNDYALFISRIKQYYESNEYAEISRALHTLKGASSYLGAESIVELAIQGESLIREQQDSKLALFVEKLDETLQSTLYEISVVID